MRRQANVDSWRAREAHNEELNDAADALMEDSRIRAMMYQQYRKEGYSYEEARAMAARNIPFKNGYRREEAAAAPSATGRRLGGGSGTAAPRPPVPCNICSTRTPRDAADGHAAQCRTLRDTLSGMGFTAEQVAAGLRGAWRESPGGPDADEVVEIILTGGEDTAAAVTAATPDDDSVIAATTTTTASKDGRPRRPRGDAEGEGGGRPTQAAAAAAAPPQRPAPRAALPPALAAIARDLKALGFHAREIVAAVRAVAGMSPPPSTEEVVDVILNLRERGGLVEEDKGAPPEPTAKRRRVG